MPQSPRVQHENVRIESWKQIASFFGRDERTVKRWEHERSLPVHRLPGERGGVFAYTLELNQWLNSNSGSKSGSRSSQQPANPKPVLIPSLIPPAPEPDLRGTAPDLRVPDPPDPLPIIEPQSPHLASPPNRLRIVLLVLGAIVALIALPYLAQAMRAAAVAHTSTPSPPQPKPEAKEAYLMGRYYWSRRTDGSLNLAVDAFTQAVVQDPAYARAYAGLAESYDLMPQYGSMPNAQAFPRAIIAAQRAIQLDPSLAEAHRALAFGQFFWEWRTSQAIPEYQRAIQLDPHDLEGHHWYATALLTLGRLPEAKAEIERARELDPTSRSILTDGALIGYSAGDVKENIQRLREVERTEPDFVTAPRYLARIALERRDFPAFILQTQLAARISANPQEQAVADAAARGWAQGGHTGMLKAIRMVQKQAFDEGRASGFELAHTSALLGEKEAAMIALQSAYDARDYMVMTIFHGDIETLMHGYPPFEALKLKVQARMNS